MKVKGTGYAAIGWRPKSATKQCQIYPKIYDKSEASRSLWKEGKSAEPEVSSDDSEIDGQSEAEAVSEDEAESKELNDEPGEAEAEAKSNDDELVEDPTLKPITRRARKVINKSIDVSIGYVTHSVSSARKRRQAEEEGKRHVDLSH